MSYGEMQEMVRRELEIIPQDSSGSPQNKLRAFYQMRRLNQLKVEPPGPPSEPFHRAVEDVRKEHPGFEPKTMDAKYFGWPEDVTATADGA